MNVKPTCFVVLVLLHFISWMAGPAEAAASFGGNARTMAPGNCASALASGTATGYGCIESWEQTLGGIRIVIRSAPVSAALISVSMCDSASNCPRTEVNPVSFTRPTTGSPAGTMERREYAFAGPLPANATQICATLNPLLPQWPPSRRPETVNLGCMPFAPQTAPAGEMQATVSEQGLIVSGWILDPAHDRPLAISIGDAGMSMQATADQPNQDSLARWPSHSATHGFRVVMPYVGQSGRQSVCLAFPGHAPGTRDACLAYWEYPQVFLTNTPYKQGQRIPYSAAMMDAGGRLRLNLFSVDGGFLLLPWENPGVGLIQANRSGAATGDIDTRSFPPGRYRLAFLCEAGCRNLPIKGFRRVDVGGASYSVTLSGPEFEITPRSRNLSLAASVSGGAITIQGTGLNAFEPASVAVVFGSRERAGRTLLLHEMTVADRRGRVTVSIPAPGLQPNTSFIAYLVRGTDDVLASSPFHP